VTGPRLTRIIPRLDVKGPHLVKGIHLEGLRVLGTPEAFARLYAETGADELIYVDVVASLYGRNSLLDLVSRTSSELLVPLTVGGGLRSLDDMRDALRAGADKVAINTAAIAQPSLIRDGARRFGSSAVVVTIEAIETSPGRYEAFTNNGREATGLDAVQWAERAVDLGAGELLLTSVDRDGTGRGYDLRLTREVARRVPVPVIASGGAGSIDHVVAALSDGCADAVAIASALHYRALELLPRPETSGLGGNTEFLRSGRPALAAVQPFTLDEVAERLSGEGFQSRSARAESTR
jgi:cyclase